MLPICLDEEQARVVLEALERFHAQEAEQCAAILQAPDSESWARTFAYHRDRRNRSHEVLVTLRSLLD